MRINPQVKGLLSVVNEEMTKVEIQNQLGLSDKKYFNKNFMLPALELDLLDMTIPDKPKSSKQKYRITDLGVRLKNKSNRYLRTKTKISNFKLLKGLGKVVDLLTIL